MAFLFVGAISLHYKCDLCLINEIFLRITYYTLRIISRALMKQSVLRWYELCTDHVKRGWFGAKLAHSLCYIIATTKKRD